MSSLFKPLIKRVLGVTTPKERYYMARLTDGRMVRINTEPGQDRPQTGDLYHGPDQQQTA